jgi:3-methyladenine DNA glycosylase AlkD
VRINWANSTIIFEVNHLSEFAGFTQSEIYHPADKNSDEVIGISEIVSYINKWAVGEVSISDVVKGINLWAAGHYYWDSSAQKFKPGTQP